jgi:hypothetical protein
MTSLRRLLTVLVAVLLIAVPASLAQGAPGGGPGKPPDAGNGSGGNGGGGQGNPGNKLGDLYADLWVVARDVSGVPETIELWGEMCLRPITDRSFEDAVEVHSGYPYEPDMYYIPLVGQLPTLMAEDEDEIEPCDVQADYVGYVDEVELGRLNLGRSPERVLSKQLRDVEIFLTSGTIGLDASGRFTRSVDDVVVQTLDSPLANLAAYQSILESEEPAMIGNVPVSGDQGLGLPLSDWQLTAAQFAAAAPKEDFVITVDTAQYLNRILGIPLVTPRTTINDEDLGERFLDYPGSMYTRSAMFPGCVEWYPIGSGTLMNERLADVALGGGELTGSGIDGYVKFAEDAHQVLVFLHALGDNVQRVDSITESGVCPTPETP